MGGCELESGDVVLAAIPIRKMTIGIAQTLPLIIDWRIAMPKRTTGGRPELKPVNVGAAAIDIGSKMHMAAVNPASTDVPVRSFGTFTQDLHDLADWFKGCGVTSVAMESTGIYWIPVYEILEQHGFDVILVNARYEIERLRLTEASSAARNCVPPKLDERRLLGMKISVQTSEPRLEVGKELLCFVPVLEANDGVVRVAHDNHVTGGASPNCSRKPTSRSMMRRPRPQQD
jgi:Transposase